MKKLIAILFLAVAFVGCKKEEPKKEPRKVNLYYTVSSPQSNTIVWHSFNNVVQAIGQNNSLYFESKEGDTVRVGWSRCLCGPSNGFLTVKIHRQMPWGEYKVVAESITNFTQGNLEYFVEELVW